MARIRSQLELWEYEENPFSASNNKGQKPVSRSDPSCKWKSRSNVLLRKGVLKVTRMKPQCGYEVNPSSGSAKNSQKHCGQSDQVWIGGATSAKVGQTSWYGKDVWWWVRRSYSPKYEENPCSGIGDIVRKPLSQSDYITTQELMQESQYQGGTMRSV